MVWHTWVGKYLHRSLLGSRGTDHSDNARLVTTDEHDAAAAAQPDANGCEDDSDNRHWVEIAVAENERLAKSVDGAGLKVIARANTTHGFTGIFGGDLSSDRDEEQHEDTQERTHAERR